VLTQLINKPSFAPEDELLLSCCRTSVEGDALDRAIECLSHPLDWDYLLGASTVHGVSPLLLGGLEQVCRVAPVKVPAQIWEALHQLARVSRERNRRMFSLVEELFSEFHKADIPAMALKDAQLAWEVYPDLTLRPMGDLDVLIPAAKYDTAKRALENIGFKAQIPPFRVLDYYWSWGFVRDGMWIDLQWNIMQEQWDNCGEGTWKFDLERMWRNAGTMRVGTTAVRVPKPEDMLFHLCVHLEGHAYGELILFCDIAELLRHYDGCLDWNYFLLLTRASEAESTVYYVLLLVRRMFDAVVPEEVLRQLRFPYLRSDLRVPLFGNLAGLHASLSRIHAVVAPPEPTMRRFEICARRQAFAAREVFALLNCLAHTFSDMGGRTLLFEGSLSEKILLDDHLSSFEPINLFVLNSQLDLLKSALARNGLAMGDGSWHADWQAVSRDRILSDIPVDFRIDAKVEKDWLSIPPEGNPNSLAKLALRVLWKALIPRSVDGGVISLSINVFPLTPEELVLRLAARLAGKSSGQLFSVCQLLSVLEREYHSIDWSLYEKVARDHHLEGPAKTGIAMAWRLFSDQPCPVVLKEDSALRRVLSVARYDAEWGRFGDFRPAFFFLHSLASTSGLSAKLQYFVKSILQRKLLRDVFIRPMAALPSVLRRRRDSGQPPVYWTRVPVAPVTKPDA
jgi:hypothetical protein